jgi:hypothetical protein
MLFPGIFRSLDHFFAHPDNTGHINSLRIGQMISSLIRTIYITYYSSKINISVHNYSFWVNKMSTSFI